MTLTINGETQDLAGESMTIIEMLEALGLGQRRVAVELNRKIVKRGTYEDSTVKGGDVVEIVHFVGGG